MTAHRWANKNLNTPAERQRRQQYASPEHKAAVAAVKALVASGQAHCWRCGRYLPPGSTAHAGHHDTDRTRYMGAECPPCNLNTAASKGARTTNAARNSTPLRW